MRGWSIITGDCRERLTANAPFDMLIADPPYGDTSLDWDKHCAGWIQTAARLLKPTGSLWVFGSMRFFMTFGAEFKSAGLAYAQDLVWEKHNGSGFHADRFKRIHENMAHFYPGASRWEDVFNEVQTEPRVGRVVVRRPRGMRAKHLSAVDQERSSYVVDDGSPAIKRSVIFMRSMHGKAIHPTEKPSDLIEILIRTSCPPGGTVGDMFSGSGAAGEAAMRAGRNYIGCEIDAAMAQKARDRLGSLLPLSAA